MKLVLAFCGGMAFVVTIAVVAMIRANAEDDPSEGRYPYYRTPKR